MPKAKNWPGSKAVLAALQNHGGAMDYRIPYQVSIHRVQTAVNDYAKRHGLRATTLQLTPRLLHISVVIRQSDGSSAAARPPAVGPAPPPARVPVTHEAFHRLFDPSRCARTDCHRRPAPRSRFCNACLEDQKAGRVVIWSGGPMLPDRDEMSKTTNRAVLLERGECSL